MGGCWTKSLTRGEESKKTATRRCATSTHPSYKLHGTQQRSCLLESHRIYQYARVQCSSTPLRGSGELQMSKQKLRESMFHSRQRLPQCIAMLWRGGGYGNTPVVPVRWCADSSSGSGGGRMRGFSSKLLVPEVIKVSGRPALYTITKALLAL